MRREQMIKQSVMWGKLGRVLRSGAPIIESIEVIAEESDDPVLRDAFFRIARGARDGQMISDTLSEMGEIFPRSLVVMIRAGENSGLLEEVLLQIPEAVREGRIGLSEEEQPASEAELARQPEARAATESLLRRALARGAAAVHLTPAADAGAVHLRIDGVLVEESRLEPEIYRAVLARLKKMADVDLMNAPPLIEGHFRLLLDREPVDLRLSGLRSSAGEAMVVRLFRPERDLLRLDQILIEDADRRRFARWIERPQGLILVTGPGGSGRSTLLHALAHHLLAAGGRKLVTVESPVQLRFDGAVQLEALPSGEPLPARIHAALRLEPDVLLIDAPEEPDALRMTLRAAAAGRLVVALMHSPGSVEALRLLLDIGLPWWQLREDLIGIVSQRLVRRLCPACRRPPAGAHGPSAECDVCRGAGYQGRRAVFEWLEPDAGVWDAARRPLEEAELRRACQAGGMVMLAEAARRLAAAGETDEAEINRAVRG